MACELLGDMCVHSCVWVRAFAFVCVCVCVYVADTYDDDNTDQWVEAMFIAKIKVYSRIRCVLESMVTEKCTPPPIPQTHRIVTPRVSFHLVSNRSMSGTAISMYT